MQQRHLCAAGVLLVFFLPLFSCLNPSVNVAGAGSSRGAAAAGIAGGLGVGGGGGSGGWANSFPLSSLRGGGWWNPGQPGGITIGGGLTKLRDTMAAKMKDGGGKGKLLEGKWRKESEVGQDKAMKQLGLNMVFRRAAGLLSKLEIRASPDLEIITKGAVVVSIKEKYSYDGKESKCARRDKRWGKHTGKITSASESKVVLDVKWGDPHGGELIETFEVGKDGKLTHSSEIKVFMDASTGKPGKWYKYASVYVRE